MRKLAFLVPFAAAAALAAAAQAQPAGVAVTLDPAFEREAQKIGMRDVQAQMDRLGAVVERALADDADLAGARIELVLTDLRPNRPTVQQLADRPGLDGHRSVSIGGAAIEGRITTADGRVVPVRYDWFSSNLGDVRGFGVWQDADRAYRRLADNLADGRYVTR